MAFEMGLLTINQGLAEIDFGLPRLNFEQFALFFFT